MCFKQEFLGTKKLPGPQQILQWWDFRPQSIWMEEMILGPRGRRWGHGSLPSAFRSYHPGGHQPPVHFPGCFPGSPGPASGRRPGAAYSVFKFKRPPGLVVRARVSRVGREGPGHRNPCRQSRVLGFLLSVRRYECVFQRRFMLTVKGSEPTRSQPVFH